MHSLLKTNLEASLYLDRVYWCLLVITGFFAALQILARANQPQKKIVCGSLSLVLQQPNTLSVLEFFFCV